MDIVNARKRFSKNLRRALSIRGIKQVDLANALNLPQTTISSWNTGRHLPDFDRLMMLCDYLKIPVGELVGDERHPQVSKEDKKWREVCIQQQYHIENLTKRNEELKQCVTKLTIPDKAKSSPDVLEVLKQAGATEVVIKFK